MELSSFVVSCVVFFFLFRDVENQNTKCDFEPLLTSSIVIRKSHKLSHSDYHAGATILQSIEEEVSLRVSGL